jgi:hypothetical protein
LEDLHVVGDHGDRGYGSCRTDRGPASAHFCFKTNLNERAAEGQAGSANWVSFHDLVFEFTGLCDEGIEILAEAGGATGYLDQRSRHHGWRHPP